MRQRLTRLGWSQYVIRVLILSVVNLAVFALPAAAQDLTMGSTIHGTARAPLLFTDPDSGPRWDFHAGVGVMNIGLKLGPSSVTTTTPGSGGGTTTIMENSGPFDVNVEHIPTWTLGGAYRRERLHVTVGFVKTLEGVDIYEQLFGATRTDDVGLGEFTELCTAGPATCLDENRILLDIDAAALHAELFASAGVDVVARDNFSVSAHAGFTYSTTSLDMRRSGQFLQRFRGNGLDLSLESDFAGDATLDFHKRGPFAGLVTGVNVGLGSWGGDLRGSVAVAHLWGTVRRDSTNGTFTNGRITDNRSGASAPVDDRTGDPVELDFDNSTIGVTLSVRWSGRTPLAGVAYSVGASAYDHEFVADQPDPLSFVADSPGPGFLAPDVTETALRINMALSYSF